MKYRVSPLCNHSNFVMNMHVYLCVLVVWCICILRSIIVNYHISRDWLLNLVRFVV